MPRHVRNFWVDVDVDGHKTPIAGGPQRPDGGLRLKIYQRDHGCVTEALTINGWADSDGTLHLVCRNGKDRIVIETER